MLYLYTKAHAAWVNRDRGASAVEYGLLVAGIAALIVAIVFIFGGNIAHIFNTSCRAIQNNGSTGGACTAAPTP